MYHQKPKSVSEQVYDELLEACSEIKGEFDCDVESFVKDKMSLLIKSGKTAFIEYLKNPQNYQKIENKIRKTVSLIQKPPPVADSDDINIFQQLYKASQKWFKLISKFNDGKCRIIVFGKTQVGKTATIKNLFGIKELKLKGGTRSDTDEIKEYVTQINGVELWLVDTPGFFDSDGRDQANFEKIKEYMSKNEIHLILWLAKLSDMPNIKERELIGSLTSTFTPTIWSNLVVVLTHANETPPQEYFEEYDDDNEDDDEEYDPYGPLISQKLITVWTKYVGNKETMWNNIFSKYGGICGNIKVSLIENNANNPYKRLNKKRDKLLINGIPMWETLMIAIFETVSNIMKPYTFLLLAGTQDDTSKCRTQQQIVASAALSVKQKMDSDTTESSVQTPKPSASASTPKPSASASTPKPSASASTPKPSAPTPTPKPSTPKPSASAGAKHQNTSWCTIL